jgi:hypothetical protein
MDGSPAYKIGTIHPITLAVKNAPFRVHVHRKLSPIDTIGGYPQNLEVMVAIHI